MTDEKNIKVLLVDDDQDYLLSQKIFFEANGFEVITAESRKEAEELLGESKFNIAVLDLMMEEADAGFVLAHQIKRIYPECPVVIVTAVVSETGIEFDEGTGKGNSWVKADAVLSKPVRFEEMLETIQRLLPE